MTKFYTFLIIGLLTNILGRLTSDFVSVVWFVISLIYFVFAFITVLKLSQKKV